MRILREQTESYLTALATSISKDPASFDGWQCMHFSPCKEIPFSVSEEILATLKNSHQEIDCDIILCTNNDVLCIGRALKRNTLYKLATLFVELVESEADHKADYAIYDVLADWRTLLAILQSKVKTSATPSYTASQHNFGDVPSLSEVFSEAQQRRKRRMPLHVMVVEDDPITRRMVTGTFKEQYAVITAVNAEEAVAGYLLHAPDIVFLDIGLPDASGLDVLYLLLQGDPRAYIVMFSGNSCLDNITRALGMGASGFVSKPFKRDRMQSYIEDSALHHRKLA